MARRTASSIRPSSIPSAAACATFVQVVIRHMRQQIEALGGPLDRSERRAFFDACRQAWQRAHHETSARLAGDPVPVRVRPMAFHDPA